MKLVNLEKNDINLKINNACFITIFFLLFRTGYDTLKWVEYCLVLVSYRCVILTKMLLRRAVYL